MKTYIAKEKEIKRKWFLVDVKGKVLGRAATKIATLLMGKHKVIYTPGVDCGDGVIVINAKDVKLTGNKLKNKFYITHSQYPGGLKKKSYEQMLKENPVKIIQSAVKDMLPDNKLRSRMMRRLKIYPDSNFPHQAQNPEKIEI